MINSKSIARLACVQALYLYEYGERFQSFDAVVDFIMSYYADSDILDDFRGHKVALHKSYFIDLSSLVLKNLSLIDESLEGVFHGRTDLLNLAIIKVGACEMRYTNSIPVKVVVNEFTNIAAAFGYNPSLVNSILDKIGNPLLATKTQDLA